MIRQLLVSLVIVGAAAAAYVFLVPGAPQQLARLGIQLPITQPAEAATGPAAHSPTGQGGGAPAQGGQQAAAGGQRPGGGGGFGGRGGNRTMVVVTAPVLLATTISSVV